MAAESLSQALRSARPRPRSSKRMSATLRDRGAVPGAPERAKASVVLLVPSVEPLSTTVTRHCQSCRSRKPHRRSSVAGRMRSSFRHGKTTCTSSREESDPAPGAVLRRAHVRCGGPAAHDTRPTRSPSVLAPGTRACAGRPQRHHTRAPRSNPGPSPRCEAGGGGGAPALPILIAVAAFSRPHLAPLAGEWVLSRFLSVRG